MYVIDKFSEWWMRTETLFQWLIRKITDEKLQYVSYWGSTETDKWYIKMWNWKEKIEVAKTITEALEILYWIDAERSQYSTDHRSDLFEKLKNQDD